MEKKKLSGKEVRYLLKQNSVNLSWLSEQLGISAQALQPLLARWANRIYSFLL